MGGSWGHDLAGRVGGHELIGVGRAHIARRMALAVTLLVVSLCAVLAQSAGAAAAPMSHLGYSLTPSKTMPYTPCPPGGRMIECDLIVDPSVVKTPSGFRLPDGPLLEGGGEGGGYDPQDLQSAYSIPTSGGTGETVALMDAYGYAAAETDLAKYRELYGLPACTKASGCFKKVNEKGEEKNYPKEGELLEFDWQEESALDLDMVSAACPHCHILLVEATTEEPKDLAASVEEAVKLGATEISNSYGFPENEETFCPGKKGCKEYLAAYDHPGIPVTVSAGDSGYDDGVSAPSWPATSPNVIAVGGTTLKRAKSSRGWSESVWVDSGSGCSLYEEKPKWQTDKGCAKRTDNDVAAIANEETPVSVYLGGWRLLGGTSVAAPLIAGIEAHANSATKTAGAEVFYKKPGMLFDITEGANGTCTPPAEDAYLCTAESGYDGPTGWGTPDGVPHLNGWFARGVPNLSSEVNVKGSSLSAASCITAEFCTAVGHALNGLSAEVALAEHWNGKEWTIQETPEANKSTLSGVSCETPELHGEKFNMCAAVGHYVNNAGTEAAFAERWAGEGWSLEEVPTPKEAKSSSLSSVSCSLDGGAEWCFAVGHYINSAGTEEALAERWNGAGWTIAELPSPKEAKSSGLSAVTCRFLGVEMCSAVGHYVNSAGTEVTLDEQVGIGKVWSVHEIATPKEAKSSSLLGVSCVSGICYAVGHYVNSAGTEVTLAETWEFNGTTSTILETLNPKEAKSSSLSGVSCTSSEACTAAGHYVNSSSVEVTLAERWNGKTWAIQETANPKEAKSSSLSGVVCTAAESCIAAGRYVNSSSAEAALAEGWNGTAWSIKETPTPKEASGSLPGVSCATGEKCTGVGHYLSGNTEVTLAEGWNGKEWSLQETATPKEAKSSSLAGVSCTTSEACTAVGRYVKSSSVEVTLAERWNGKTWAIQETATPKEAKSSSLAGVSCASATACTAVGHYVNSSSVEVTLAESWNGTTWAVQETATPKEAKSSSLTGVSCTTSEACTAVGRYVNSAGTEVTLAERWNGKTWAVQETVTPKEAKSSSLAGVSCASATACTAVGHYVNSSSVEVTLAESWNGTTWAVQETATPKEAKSSSLAGVSCTTSEACTAVGRYVNSSSVEVTLAESWNGKTWATQETPNPEAKSSSLSSVSCTSSSTSCVATGHSIDDTDVEVALVEEYN